MNGKLTGFLILLLLISCSQRIYYRNYVLINGPEKKAKVLSLTQQLLPTNEMSILNGKFVAAGSGDSIPNITFFLTSKTDTIRLNTNNFGEFSFSSQKNEIFKMTIKYVGIEPCVVDSIPLAKGKQISFLVELKEQLVPD
jgi:hypothetical protein